MLCSFCGMKGAIYTVDATVDGKRYKWDSCLRCRQRYMNGELDVSKFLYRTVGRIVE